METVCGGQCIRLNAMLKNYVKTSRSLGKVRTGSRAHAGFYLTE